MMTPDSAACVKFVKFPRWGFDSLEALPSAANTCMRLGKPAKILLQTYQEYYWTIQVKQVIHRAIKVKNQVGEAIVDESNKTVFMLPRSKNWMRFKSIPWNWEEVKQP